MLKHLIMCVPVVFALQSCGIENKLSLQDKKYTNQHNATIYSFIKNDFENVPNLNLHNCRNYSSILNSLRSERASASLHKDDNNIQNIDLNISHTLDLINLCSSDELNYNEVSSINKKYEQLEHIVNNYPNGFRPYTENETLAVQAVFKEYGQLMVQLPKNNEAIKGLANTDAPMPWAGYWYPASGRELFDGNNSPLFKYDKLMASLGISTNAAAYEKSRYNTSGDAWTGLCDAWSFASILTKEPITPLTYKNIRFEISDLKALLIKSYEGYSPIIYGNRYYGNALTDGEYQDLRPEAFHKLVIAVIGEQKKALVVDTDPSPEVWNKPFFRMSWSMKIDPQYPNAIVVNAFPSFTKNHLQVSEAITTEFDVTTPEYQYRLFYDPESLTADGKVKIISGQWYGSSLEQHPDVVATAKNNPVIIPANPELAKGINTINDLFNRGIPTR